MYKRGMFFCLALAMIAGVSSCDWEDWVLRSIDEEKVNKAIGDFLFGTDGYTLDINGVAYSGSTRFLRYTPSAYYSTEDSLYIYTLLHVGAESFEPIPSPWIFFLMKIGIDDWQEGKTFPILNNGSLSGDEFYVDVEGHSSERLEGTIYHYYTVQDGWLVPLATDKKNKRAFRIQIEVTGDEDNAEYTISGTGVFKCEKVPWGDFKGPIRYCYPGF